MTEKVFIKKIHYLSVLNNEVHNRVIINIITKAIAKGSKSMKNSFGIAKKRIGIIKKVIILVIIPRFLNLFILSKLFFSINIFLLIKCNDYLFKLF